MLDAIRGYVQLASGLVEVSVAKAKEVAESLLAGDINEPRDAASAAASAAATSVRDLADDIVNQASANREILVGMIRSEVDKAVGRLGLVREDELAALRRRVEGLEIQRKAAAKKAPAKKAATSSPAGGS